MNKKSKTNIYQIKITEKLQDDWKDWFTDMEISFEKTKGDETVTILTGPVSDQSALNGLLTKIWNFNLTILSVERIDS